MSFENPQASSQEDNDREEHGHENKSERLFNISRQIGDMDVSIDIERDGEPITAAIDLDNGIAEIRVTPEGVQRGVHAVSEMLSSSTPEIKREFNEGMNSILDELDSTIPEVQRESLTAKIFRKEIAFIKKLLGSKDK